MGPTETPASDPRLVPLFAHAAGKWTAAGPVPDHVRWWEVANGRSRDKLDLRGENDPKAVDDPYRRAIGERTRAHLTKDNSAVITRLAARVRANLNSLAASSSSVRDPAGWERVVAGEDSIQRVKSAFIEKFKVRRVCTPDAVEPPWENLSLSSRKLTQSDLEIDPRAFKSRDGQLLIGIYPRGKVCLLDPYVVNQFYQKRWFWIDHESVREVLDEPDGSRRRSVEPIDAADWDGDGRSEWIFRENGSGGGDLGGSSFWLLGPGFEKLIGTVSPLPGVPGESVR